MAASKAEIAGMAGVLLTVVSIPALAAYDTWSNRRALKAGARRSSSRAWGGGRR